MSTVINILQRVLVNYFYKVNAGFFLFVFFVLFGIPVPAAGFHLSLINGIIDSKIFLLLVFAAWLLYNLKCINYIIKQLLHEKQSFLFVLNNLTTNRRILSMLYVHAMVYLPAILYGAAITVIALQRHSYTTAIQVILFNLTVTAASAFVYVFALQRKELPVISNLSALSFRFPKPLFSIPLFFIWHNRRQMLLVTKIFSLSLLFALIKLYDPEYYDVRPLLLACMLCAAAHCGLVFQAREFEEEYLSFTRSLPLSLLQRFGNLFLAYSFLMLPEFLFLWKGYPLYFTVADYFQLLLMMVALLCFFYTVLLTDNLAMDSYLRLVFGILAGLFFVVLYNPGILLPCLLLAVSFLLYIFYFYDYEKRF